MKLSICMMVKNEEEYLEQSLSSLKPILESVSSELIVVDTGSTDNTVEIAKKHTDSVYFHEWTGNFADMRNITIKYAKGDWILILDGDEIIEQPEALINFFNSKKSSRYMSAMLTICNILVEDKVDGIVTSLALRLFVRKGFYYVGAIHEQPIYKEPVVEIKTNIIHYGYLSTDKSLMNYKYKRNVEILKKELDKDPDNIYYWFQLSQSYGMNNEPRKALDANIKAYELTKSSGVKFSDKLYVFIHLAQAYTWVKDYIQVEKICLETMKIQNNLVDITFYLAEAQINLGKYKEAEESYERYLLYLKQDNFHRSASIVNMTIGKYEYAYNNLCYINIKNDDYDTALSYALKVQSIDPLKNVIPYIIRIYIDTDRYNDLYNYYQSLLENNDDDLNKVFWNSLDNYINSKADNIRDAVVKIFSIGDCKYSFLNKIRLYIKNNDNTNESKMLPLIDEFNFEELPISFSDILYYLIKRNIPIERYMRNIRESTFQVQIDYLSRRYNDLSQVMLCYLNANLLGDDLISLKTRKVMERSIVLLNDIDEEDFNQSWENYIEVGTKYIEKLYSSSVIEDELYYETKNNEEAFLICIIGANKIKDSNKLEYVKYLRKALKFYPAMNKGIEILVEQAEEKSAQANEAKNEFEELKEIVKGNIDILLKARRLDDAIVLVDEYLSIVPDDLEILALKSKIALSIDV